MLGGVSHANGTPIGLRLNQVARIVGQEFDRALVEAGGSLPVWLVLLSLQSRRPATQRELATLIGITEATLSHHLNAMERQGLVTRVRNETNRRVHDVGVTADGIRLFGELRHVAQGFDARLNRGLSGDEQSQLAGLLDRLAANSVAGAGGRDPLRDDLSEPDRQAERH